jgi:hypothetical protein
LARDIPAMTNIPTCDEIVAISIQWSDFAEEDIIVCEAFDEFRIFQDGGCDELVSELHLVETVTILTLTGSTFSGTARCVFKMDSIILNSA